MSDFKYVIEVSNDLKKWAMLAYYKNLSMWKYKRAVDTETGAVSEVSICGGK